MANYTSVQNGEWDDGSTWGGGYPSAAGDTATITHTVTYSISADVELGQIDIDSGGTLSFNPSADTYMEIQNNTFLYINSGGTLAIGTSASPIHKDYTAQLAFNCSTDNAGGFYSQGGDVVMYGDIDYFGGDKETFVAYDCTGSTSITATDDMSSKWNIGDEIGIGEKNTYVNWPTQGAYSTITGFDGNVIECADAIGTAIVSGGIIINLSRNVKLYKVGYTKGWNQNNSGRPYNYFHSASYGNDKFFYSVEFGGFSRAIDNAHMNEPVLGAAPGSIDWCSFRNGNLAMYSFYGALIRDCVFFSFYQTLHSIHSIRLYDTIFLGLTYGIYGCHWIDSDGCYASNCTTPYQYARGGQVRNYLGYSNVNEFSSGESLDVHDSYMGYTNTGTNAFQRGRFFDCGWGVDIDGKEINNNFNMPFGSVDVEYINCLVSTANQPDERYRHNLPDYSETKYKWENYNRVEGDHRLYSNFGTALKIDADGGGDNPTQRTGGNPTLFEIFTESRCGTVTNVYTFKPIKQQIYAQADLPRTIRYYIQTDYTDGLSSDEIWLDVNYGSTNVQSTSSISVRSNQSDWSQYLEVTINPTQDGWVRIDLVINAYESGKYIWVDPKPEVV